MHPVKSTLMLAGLGSMPTSRTPPRYMGVWMFRPWALPGDVFFSMGPWSTLSWPSLMFRSATTRCHWPRETGSGLRKMAWPVEARRRRRRHHHQWFNQTFRL